MTFTFFDLIAAMRNGTTLLFTWAGSNRMDQVVAVSMFGHGGRTWRLILESDDSTITWNEANTGNTGPVISVV